MLRWSINLRKYSFNQILLFMTTTYNSEKRDKKITKCSREKQIMQHNVKTCTFKGKEKENMEA